MNKKILFVVIALALVIGLAATFFLTVMGNDNTSARDYEEFLEIYDPSDCTDTNCAQEVIGSCLVRSVTLTYDIPLTGSLAIVSRGWHDDVCEMIITTLPGERAAKPAPVYACNIPQGNLSSWVGWRNSAHDGIVGVESWCD